MNRPIRVTIGGQLGLLLKAAVLFASVLACASLFPGQLFAGEVLRLQGGDRDRKSVV